MYFPFSISNPLVIIWVMTTHKISWVVRRNKFFEKIAAPFLVPWVEFYRNIVLISCIETWGGSPKSGSETWLEPLPNLSTITCRCNTPCPLQTNQNCLSPKWLFCGQISLDIIVHRLGRNITYLLTYLLNNLLTYLFNK